MFIYPATLSGMPIEQDPPALAVVRARLDDVRRSLQAARARLAAGGAVDLTGMDTSLALLCEQALALAPPQAREALPQLVALRDTVSGLIETLASRPVR